MNLAEIDFEVAFNVYPCSSDIVSLFFTTSQPHSKNSRSRIDQHVIFATLIWFTYSSGLLILLFGGSLI